MGLITSVAYFSMCKCGKHGQFVLADGTKGPEFCSKDIAREELKKLRESKSITDLEFKFLNSQISLEKRLSNMESETDLFVRLVCNLTNALVESSNEEVEFRKYVHNEPNKYLM